MCHDEGLGGIDVAQGVLQGDTLAPFLFVCVIDAILRSLPKEKGVKIGQNLFHFSLAYADDICLMTSSCDDMQHLFSVFESTALCYGLKLNFGKGENRIHGFSRECRRHNHFSQRIPVPCVHDYKYLVTCDTVVNLALRAASQEES